MGRETGWTAGASADERASGEGGGDRRRRGGGRLLRKRSAGRDFLREIGATVPALDEPRRRSGRWNHQRRRRSQARILEAHFDFTPAAAYCGHGDQRAGESRLRAVRLVRGTRWGGGRGSHGCPCARGCFSAKIWRRLVR